MTKAIGLDARSASADATGSEDAFEDLLTRGRRAWPGVVLSDEQRSSFLRAARANHRPGERALHEDLFLAYACTLGVAAAREALDRSIMADVPKAIRRVSTEPAFVADVAADLRLALLDEHEGKSSVLERYQGKGPLRSFVMVLAMRRAIDRKRREKEISTESHALVDLAAENPSGAHVGSSELSDAFLEVLKERLSTLPPRDRNVLRLHIVDGIPAETIARMYGVHRATATRWITDVKRQVFEETRDSLQRRLNVSPATFESFAREAALGLDASLSTFLSRDST